MLGKNHGFVTTQGQIVAELFAAENDYQITCVSAKINRVARLFEIISTLISKGGKFDLVILEVYSGLSFIIAEVCAFVCRFLNIPLAMVLHGGSLPEFAEAHPRRVRQALRKANLLIAPSRFLAEKFSQYGFEIRVVPNTLDLENYSFRQREKISPRLFWMRSFHEIYNPQMAVEVIAELQKTFPAATLVMAGRDKGAKSDVELSIERHGLKESVRLKSFLDREQKLAEFAAADIYLNTNLVDNMPVSVLEACAAGLPIVAANVGGLPFLIEDGTNGLLVESGNAAAMTEAVKKLLKDAQLTAKISRNARLLAEQSAWSAVKKQWENLFAEICEQRNFETSAPTAENEYSAREI